MITKLPKVALIFVFAIVLTIFWAGVALAESPDGLSPDSAMAPGDWMSVNAGEMHWFAFNFDYDGKPEMVEIFLYADPDNGAAFNVRNVEQVRLWKTEGKDEWFGAGTENEYAKGALSWAGALESSGTYYVVVEHNALTPGPTACKLEIVGKGVTFPVAAEPVAAPVVMGPSEPTAAVPTIKMGGGPDEAIAPTGEWTTLAVGEQHWYAFDFGYDAKITEPIQIKVYAEPAESAVVTIRNAEQAELWRTEGANEHFGCCTVQSFSKDEETPYAIWSGQLFSSGRYYIVVEHAKNVAVPTTYRFTIEGEKISFPTAKAAPVEAIPAPAPAEPAMVASKVGGGPDEAMAPTGELTKLEAGATHWYAFKYDFDEGFDPIEIKVYANPENGAVLTVRNEEQAQLWREEGANEHFGCCTVETISGEESDYGVWVGRPDSSGTYYLVVEHAKNVAGPITYSFTITGEGVSY
jgi:hypothetical protein